MKILSWNVNGLQERLNAVNRLAAELRPELMCFQKVRKKGAYLTTIDGYMGWQSVMEGGLFGGVSVYIRQDVIPALEAQQEDMPQWLFESGCLNVVVFEEFILVNAYFPYSNKRKEEFVRNRRRWDYEFHDYVVRLTRRKPVILCGDLNIVAQDRDAWDGVSVRNIACFTEWEHRNFNSMLEQAGLTDTYRYLHPDGRDYSYFFQNRPEYRRANQGFRIDYCLMSGDLLPGLRKSEILTDIADTTNSPLLVEIEL